MAINNEISLDHPNPSHRHQQRTYVNKISLFVKK